MVLSHLQQMIARMEGAKFFILLHWVVIWIPVFFTIIPVPEYYRRIFEILNLILLPNTEVMMKPLRIESVSQVNRDRGHKTLHPLVSVLDHSFSKPVKEARYISELYMIFLKDEKCGELKYGRNHYDYEEGTLLFIAPGQVFGFEESEKMMQPTGWTLVFHPDLIRGTHLGKCMDKYSFFSYDVNEALHISDAEREIVLECFNKIRYELAHPIDKHSRTLIVSNIEMFLNYSVRFYDRQFLTREHIHKDVLAGFEGLLNDYFQTEKPQTLGLPSVSYCAAQLNLSPKYFGDLVRKETGKSAQEYIQLKLIVAAKEQILDMSKSVSEVAYKLGFKYPSHFTRFFKQHVGHSPNEYRNSLN